MDCLISNCFTMSAGPQAQRNPLYSRKEGMMDREESQLTRKAFLKTVLLGGAALLLSQAKEAAAAEVPADIPLYTGEPCIGEPGYEKRIAGIFAQATVKKG